jgi:uncharacterized protein (DUF1697 family)
MVVRSTDARAIRKSPQGQDRQVALIRGINVGRAKRVAMADLRALVEELGYRDVSTVLNSGNVVFTVPGTVRGSAASRIEQGMSARLGVPARVTVVTASELAGIVDENPFGDVADDPSRLLVGVLMDTSDRTRLQSLARRDWTPERFGLGRRAAYMWCSGGFMASKIAPAVGKLLGDAVTTRNWATIMKLNAMAGPL